MEVVALVHAGEAPVETGLVFVMTGAEFGEDSFSIRGNDGVEKGPLARSRGLGEDRIGQVRAVNRNRSSFLVPPEAQIFSGEK